jgi:peptide/nickel transport system permease protein
MNAEYVFKRFLLFLAVVVVAVSINFLIPRMRSTNPIKERLYQLAAQGGVNVGKMEEMIKVWEKKFGLDQPLWKQYINYWNDVIHLDFGKTIADFTPVITEIMRSVPWTIGMLSVATVIAFGVGTIFGALLAWPKTGNFVKIFVPFLMTLSAIPYYLLGIVMIYSFAIYWPILPTSGAYSFGVKPEWSIEMVLSVISHAIMPAGSIVLTSIGFWGLGMRGMMITTMGEDYMKFAEYKGLKDRRIFLSYGVRNAMLPQVTGLAISLGTILAGSVLVEVIFAYPGLGNLLYTAISSNDYFLLQGIMIFVIVSLGFSLFLIDLLYPFIDPRIRLQGEQQ